MIPIILLIGIGFLLQIPKPSRDNLYQKEGFADLHLFPGEGNIQWAEVIRALKDIRFRGAMNIEPIGVLPSLTDPERRRALADGLEKLKAML